ncbi:helix-turn-helix domain-containing protein [Flavobacterium aquidurense]|uniref:XRE family transcriptional regulator n=1 Tax=Flavobacterium aquidurense TaxID=362413 RepID=A0A0Q0S605_9FLAO|nr:helix-turn-helix transcriptional regulator [Flavobacterium aquidurense]KQB38791.1 XRE family transcriptional regulator [Flavobacterium aquidurense]
MSTATRPKHIGRNISRIRELRGMKQDILAEAIGVSQQMVSNIEGSETVDIEKLAQIAKVLGVPVEAIENFSEENVFNYFASFYDNSSNTGAVYQFNPIEKVVELYERLVQAEKEKNEYLERMLKDK